jgi:hypothetical protein
VQNAEVWTDLTQVIADSDTLKHFFKDYCKTDVVQSPIAELYQDAMSVGLEDREGLLLVCRDNVGHAEPAVACVPLSHNAALRILVDAVL